MGFLDTLRKIFSGGTSGGSDANVYWIYARCRRCGEPLMGRIDLRTELSQDEDDNWIVRKGLIGSGERRCFQTVEVTLKFDGRKETILESEATGGELITREEYEKLARGG